MTTAGAAAKSSIVLAVSMSLFAGSRRTVRGPPDSATDRHPLIGAECDLPSAGVHEACHARETCYAHGSTHQQEPGSTARRRRPGGQARQSGDHPRALDGRHPRSGWRHRAAAGREGGRERRCAEARSRRAHREPAAGFGRRGAALRASHLAADEQGGGRGQEAQGRLHLDRALRAQRREERQRPQGRLRSSRAVVRQAAARPGGGARQPARHGPGPGREVPGAREVHQGPHRARQARQARPGDRSRRGDPSRDAGAEPAHQEQPGA